MNGYITSGSRFWNKLFGHDKPEDPRVPLSAESLAEMELPNSRAIHPLSLMTCTTPPRNGWSSLYPDCKTVPDALEKIKSQFGEIKDVVTDDDIGVTFLSVFSEGRWQRAAIGTFPGVWCSSYPSDQVSEYEASITASINRANTEDMKR